MFRDIDLFAPLEVYSEVKERFMRFFYGFRVLTENWVKLQSPSGCMIELIPIPGRLIEVGKKYPLEFWVASNLAKISNGRPMFLSAKFLAKLYVVLEEHGEPSPDNVAEALKVQGGYWKGGVRFHKEVLELAYYLFRYAYFSEREFGDNYADRSRVFRERICSYIKKLSEKGVDASCTLTS